MDYNSLPDDTIIGVTKKQLDDLFAEQEGLRDKIQVVIEWLKDPATPWPDKKSAEQAHKIFKQLERGE